MFMRYKPTWFKKPPHPKVHKPPTEEHLHKKFKLHIPKILHVKKKIPHLKPVHKFD
jgi:hypothetical protein